MRISDLSRIDIYKSSKRQAFALQMLRNASSDLSRPPDDDCVRFTQWPKSQISGLRPEEVLYRIAGVLPGQSAIALAPGQEDSWNFRKLLSCHMHSQPEVIVLGPAIVRIATHFFQVGFPYTYGGMYQGTLDEDIPSDISRQKQGIDPSLIDAESFADFGDGETSDLSSNRRYVSVLAQEFVLYLQPVRVTNVVRIHSGDQPTGTNAETRI